MQQNTQRYDTSIEDGTIYVEADLGRVEIGPVSDIIQRFGDTYVIEYDDWEKERYDVSFADEGIEMDVRQTIESMTHSERIVKLLKEKPLNHDESTFDGSLRMAMFFGMVNDALQNGPY